MNKIGEKVIELYSKGKSLRQVANELHISKASVSYWINEVGISRHKPSIEITDELLEKIQQRYDELGNLAIVAKEFGISINRLERIARYNKEIIAKTRYEIVKNRRYRIKKFLVDYKGGNCEICGYNKCLNALEFHHLNPEEKDFNISQFSKYQDMSSLKAEVNKCILVCANCHREIHAGLIKLG